MSKIIRIFDLKFSKNNIKQFINSSKEIFKNGFFSNHKFVDKFEKKFSVFNSSKYCLSVSSGTSALEVILKSLELKKKNVLVNSNTFIATGHAIKNSGYKIVPVDIDKKFYGMCPEDLEKKIKFNNIGAVVVVHIGGIITPNIFKIKKLCKKYKVYLIEDAAQAQGSSYKKIKAGNFGFAAAFSFFTTKVMTTGEGGMVVTNNKNFYLKCFSYRQFGMSLKDNRKHLRISSNYKFNEFSALLGTIELNRVNSRIKKRNQLSRTYQDILKNSSFKIIKPLKDMKINFYKQILVSKFDKTKIKKFLKKNKIDLTGGVYDIPLHLQPIYEKELKKFKLKNTEFFCKHHFCPPCYPELSIKKIKYICKILISYDQKMNRNNFQ